MQSRRLRSAYAGKRLSRKEIFLFGRNPLTIMNASIQESSIKHPTFARMIMLMLHGKKFPAHSFYTIQIDATINFINRYKKMETCMTPLPEVSNDDEVAGGELQKWPERAFAVPPRISRETIPGITPEKFEEDNKLWKERVAYYKKIIPTLSHGRYRNVMDMNANLGGFAAAMDKFNVWVMNVVPVNSDHDTLGVIYERGFIGTYHDWCEAFSTYPRTYDFIHADSVFSIYQDRYITKFLLYGLFSFASAAWPSRNFCHFILLQHHMFRNNLTLPVVKVLGMP